MDVVSKNWIRHQNIKRNSPNLLITFLLSTPLPEKMYVCVLLLMIKESHTEMYANVLFFFSDDINIDVGLLTWPRPCADC